MSTLKEETFLIPLKYIDVTMSTHTYLDVMQETWIDDCWNVDSSKHLSDIWTGFTKRTFGPWEETDKDSNNIQTGSCMSRSLDENLKATQNREKQEREKVKPKLDTA